MPGNTCQEAMHVFDLVTDPLYLNIHEQCTDLCLEGSMPDTTAVDGCGFNQSPTVWVQIGTDNVPPVALITSIVPHGLWKPLWSVFYSPTNSCNDLIPINNFENTGYCFDGNSTTPIINNINTYWIAITADPDGPPVDNPNFTLCAYTRVEALTCVGPTGGCNENDPSLRWVATWRENGGDLNGPFCPGEAVTFTMTYLYDSHESSLDWFQGFIPDFGPGWDLPNFDWTGNIPIANEIKATFHEEGSECAALVHLTFPHLCTFRDEFGSLRMRHRECDDDFTECSEPILLANLGKLPNGYFWLNPTSSSPTCNDSSCKPLYRWGIGSYLAQVIWTYTVRVREFDDPLLCVKNKDLQMSFLAFADSGTGCWDDIAPCRLDKKQYSPPYIISCDGLLNIPEVIANDAQVCDREPLNVPFQTSDGSSHEIEVWFEENEFVTGMKNHLFAGGSGIMEDTLSIIGSACEPYEVKYFARVRKQLNCGVITPVDTFSVTVWPKPSMAAQMDTICYSNLPSELEVTIQCGDQENIHCNWTHVATGTTGSGYVIMLNNSFDPGLNQFMVDLFYDWGCTETDTMDVEIIGIDTTVLVQVDTLTSLQSGAQYQWLNCNEGFMEIPDATDQSFTPLNSGSYAVEITKDGCVDTSHCHRLILSDVLENTIGQGLKVFPNPTDGTISIELPEVFSFIEVKVSSIEGKEMAKKSFINAQTLQMSLQDYQQGMYFLNIQTGEKHAMVKVFRL